MTVARVKGAPEGARAKWRDRAASGSAPAAAAATGPKASRSKAAGSTAPRPSSGGLYIRQPQAPRPPAPAPAPAAEPELEPEPAPSSPAAAQVEHHERAGVEEILDEDLLADLLRRLSIQISALDGAGAAGYLTAIEARQAAHFLLMPARDMVARYFRGSVSEFRMAIGLLMIFLAVGRAHLAAIGARFREQRRPARDVTPPAAAPAEPVPTNTEPIERQEAPIPPADPLRFEELARRQARARQIAPGEATAGAL